MGHNELIIINNIRRKLIVIGLVFERAMNNLSQALTVVQEVYTLNNISFSVADISILFTLRVETKKALKLITQIVKVIIQYS